MKKLDGRYQDISYPELTFSDNHFPGKVYMKAFNPFIPLNDKDSSLPAAFFEITFENQQDEPVEYTACFSLNNPLPYATTENNFWKR